MDLCEVKGHVSPTNKYGILFREDKLLITDVRQRESKQECSEYSYVCFHIGLGHSLWIKGDDLFNTKRIT